MKDLEVRLKCPGCGNRLVEKIKNMKAGNAIKCPRCRSIIRYTKGDLSKFKDLAKRFAK